jgi:hypothetical protein
VALWKRAGPISQRSVDQNYALLTLHFFWSEVRRLKLRSAVAKGPGKLVGKVQWHMI